MSDVTSILEEIEAGNPGSASSLFPVVYDELRKMASSQMAHERSDHTLQTTALVHEAYVRLVDTKRAQNWNSRGHFFAAAAESMRRILVEHARRKLGKQRGGDWKRQSFDEGIGAVSDDPELVLQVSDAIDELTKQDQQAAELVKLHCFGGYSIPEAATSLGIPTSSAYLHWTFAKAVIGKIFVESSH